MTDNPTCNTIRATHAAAKAQWNLPSRDLELAKDLAEGARQLLAQAYALVKAHPTLAIQAETAGKSAKHLRESCSARFTGQVPQ